MAAVDLDRLIQLHEYSSAILRAPGVPADFDRTTTSALAYSPDGRFLAVGGCTAPLGGAIPSRGYCGDPDSGSSTARTFLIVLDANTEGLVASLPETEPHTTITDLAFTHDGGIVFYTLHNPKSDSQLFAWDMDSQRAEPYHWAGRGYPSVDVSPDDRWLALDNGTQDDSTGKVSIFDLASGGLARELPAGYYDPHFSRDGTKLAIAPYGQVAVYEAGAWNMVGSIDLPCERRCYVALSPDLSLLATSEALQDNAPVLVSDIASGHQVQSLPAGDDNTRLLVFTPDGSMLWNLTDGAQVTVWDAETWQSLGSKGFLRELYILDPGEIQFADNGRTLLVADFLFISLLGLP
jgi:WD40 repeat protein